MADKAAAPRIGAFDASVLALATAYFMSQFYRSFLAVLYPDLSADLGVTADTLSLASSVWFLTFALAQFPVGWALDRLGPRATAPLVFALGAGGGSVLFATAETPNAIIVAMGLIGVGCAPVLMASFWLFARLFAPRRFATLSGAIIGFGTLGNVLAAAPLGALAEAAGWRGAAFAVALLSALIALAVALSTPPLDELRRPAERDTDSARSRSGGFGAVLSIRGLWPIFPLMFAAYAAPAALRGAWIAPYFVDVHGLGRDAVDQAALAMALAMVVGSLGLSALDRALGTRKWISVAATSVALAAMVWLAIEPAMAPWRATALMTAIGLFGMTYPMMMAHGRAFVPLELTGRGVTLLNFFSIAGVGLTLAGLSALFRAATPAEGPAQAGAYAAVFWALAASLAIGLVVYLFSEDRPPEA